MDNTKLSWNVFGMCMAKWWRGREGVKRVRQLNRFKGVSMIHLDQIFPNCAPRSTKCSAEHLQVLRKEIGKKNKINVTRSENCEFVRPWPVYRYVLGRNYLTPAACCEAVYTASITDLSACHASAESACPPAFSEPRETSRMCAPRVSSHLQSVAWAFSRKSKRIKSQCSVIYFVCF